MNNKYSQKLKESRSKHLLKDYEQALKQIALFKRAMLESQTK